MLRNFFQTHKLVTSVIKHDAVIKRCAGHSKWQNIRHTKALKDGQRAVLFTKLSRMMKVAIQEHGSPDPTKNLKLEQVIEQARRANMPSDTIKSILKSSQADKSLAKPYVIEIKGPGSCIILCEVFTDNLHHTKQLITTILKKHGSKFSDGGGKHLFNQKGVIDVDIPKDATPEKILETATDHAIESGAEDVQIINDDLLRFTCAVSSLREVTKVLETLKYKINSSSVEYVALRLQPLSDSDLDWCSALYDKLENHKDVVRITDNIA